MTINFSRNNPVLTARGSVAFYANLNAEVVLCEISADALLKGFNASGTSAVSLISSFENNRRQIEIAAANLLLGRPERGQSVMLSYSDFAFADAGTGAASKVGIL